MFLGVVLTALRGRLLLAGVNIVDMSWSFCEELAEVGRTKLTEDVLTSVLLSRIKSSNCCSVLYVF